MFRETHRAVDVLAEDLIAVRNGQTPPHSKEELLKSFHLDGNVPDGKTLAKRLMDGGDVFSQYSETKKVEAVMIGVLQTVTHISINEATPAEEVFAENLAAVAAAQLIREGNICPGAMALSIELIKARPQYMPVEAQQKIVENLMDRLTILTSTDLFRSMAPRRNHGDIFK